MSSTLRVPVHQERNKQADVKLRPVADRSRQLTPPLTDAPVIAAGSLDWGQSRMQIHTRN